MKLSHLRIGLLLLVLLVSTSGCGYVNSIRAKSQLNEAVSAYKDKRYDEAEKYARKAISLDPTNENGPLILAVVLQTEYRRGDTSDVNVKRAEESIQLYKEVEKQDPNNDQAFTTVTVLLGYLGKTDEQLEWVKQRANNGNVSKDKRAEAYAFLANKDWDCSRAVTDKSQQRVSKPDGSVVIQYKKPTDSKEYDDAVKCMTEGMQLAETAISMDTESETAWAQKYNLLLEAGKLAKMDGNDSKATEYEKQATEAREQGKKLHEKAKAAQTPTPPAG
jgi:tetratricopeptide (TPR) repeat protein